MNNNYDNLPAVLNANQLAAALGKETIDSYNTGERLLVPKDKLVEWIEQNTGGVNGD